MWAQMADISNALNNVMFSIAWALLFRRTIMREGIVLILSSCELSEDGLGMKA